MHRERSNSEKVWKVCVKRKLAAVYMLVRREWGGHKRLLYLQLKKSVLPGSNSRSHENEAHSIGDQEASLLVKQRKYPQQATTTWNESLHSP